MRRRLVSAVLIGTLIGLGAVIAEQARAADPAPCAAPVPSTTQPGYLVADPFCDFGTTRRFAPLTDPAGQPISRVFAGIRDGAAFRVEVPLRWNGELVLWAHGFRGDGTVVVVDQHPLRAFLVAQGFAWAASSYETNGYDVGQGARDSHELIALFGDVAGARASAVYMTGASMGGHITAVTIEHFRRDFVGALPLCGVLGDTELFDYFLDASVTAFALTGNRLPFELAPPPDFPATFAAQVRGLLPQLGGGFATGRPPVLTELGQLWAATVEQRSGGTRPGFASAFAFWSSFGRAPLTDIPFLFGLYPGFDGGRIGIADGNVTSNLTTIYQFDNRFALSPAELRLNLAARRIAPTAQASRDLTGIPAVAGTPDVPVLSLHDLGDLFVPFSMEQVYARRVLLHGRGSQLVARAIRGVGHCDFTPAELVRAFTDLVGWVRTGQRPAGDAILDRRAVARPDFGCRFTDGPHPGFTANPCPSS